MKYLKIIICALCFSITLCGCQSRLLQSKLLTVHKIDVQQGNALESDAVEKLTLGATKEQVLYALGNPLIIDSFHPDRWDYIFILDPGHGEQQRRQLTLIFDRNEVIKIIKHNIVKDDASITTEDKQLVIDEED